MKRDYKKPTMRVVELRNNHHLLSGSPVDSVDGNTNLKYRGGGSGPARSRSNDADWDDDW